MTTELPPGPRLPPAVQTLAWFTRPVPFVLRAQRRFGDVFTMRIAGESAPWVKLGHPDLVREVFTGSPDKLLAGQGNEILRPVLGDHSVLLLDRAEHMRERKLILPAFHGERMQRYGDLMREVAEAEIASWPAGEQLELAPRMQALTLEVIIRAVFGVRDATRRRAMRTALGELLDILTEPIGFALASTIGAERATRVGPARRTLAAVDALVQQEIDAHRGDDDLAERDDILSWLLRGRDEDGEPMSDRALRDELVTLLTAGHETTATALSWAIERLLRTPAAMERLTAEVESGRREYTLAVAHETLRLRPVIPLVLRTLAEPMTVGGIDLPAGVKVAPSVIMVHRRADIYPDPHAFRPERFLGVKPGTYTWIPFGGGVRRCLGAAFALFEMEVVLESVVRSAKLRPARPAPERVRRRAITLAPARRTSVVREPVAA
ncbi:MAG: cytochrome P450 [Solirubrobacteraceae bacterium]